MSFGFESSKWSMFQRTLPLNGLIRHKPALIRSHPQAITPKTMASNDRVRQEIAAFRQSLLDEGSLGDMFINLEDLEKHGNPNFVQEIMTNYFRDSTKYMDNVEQLLNETTVNFMEVSRLAYKLNRSTGFVGAHKVSYPASQLKEHAYSGNLDGCRASLQLVKREHAELRGKIETYFQMMRRAGPVETAERPVSRAADNA